MSMLRITAIVSSVAIVGLLGGLWYVSREQSDDIFAACRSSVVAGGSSMIGGPFTLVDETGATVTETDVIDQPVLIYFGYTYCPDVCPLDNARNAAAIQLLEDRGEMVKPVFITIDPERDTPEVLADFTDYLHPRMLGLTGSPEQIKVAADAYRTYYAKNDPEDGDDEYYLMDHMTFSYLVFPETGFAEFFRRDISAEDMAEQVSCFLDAAA